MEGKLNKWFEGIVLVDQKWVVGLPNDASSFSANLRQLAAWNAAEGEALPQAHRRRTTPPTKRSLTKWQFTRLSRSAPRPLVSHPFPSAQKCCISKPAPTSRLRSQCNAQTTAPSRVTRVFCALVAHRRFFVVQLSPRALLFSASLRARAQRHRRRSPPFSAFSLCAWGCALGPPPAHRQPRGETAENPD